MTLDEAIKHCEEVIEELEKEAQEWHENQVRKCELIPFAEMDYTHENDCIECARDHKQLAEWLKELKQLREQTRWIPVSERLPEYGTEVLTCSRGGYVEIQSLETYGEYWENQHGDWTDFDEVIAWRPLPKPYKAEMERVNEV